MSKLVTIYGGSGFVGRYIARRMAKDGWRVRVAVRRPNEAMFVRPYGTPGQVEPILCNIRDDASVRAAMQGADVVVNCVGILEESGKNSFEAVQKDGAARVARIAAESGVARMVHVSALGADAGSNSEYARTKAAGEAAVLDHMPDAMILRPSIIFGAEDAFFNRFAQMAAISPILPVVGAATKFQPVYVEDVAHAAALGAEGAVAGGIFELGGPDVEDFRTLMQRMCEVIRRRRVIVNLPFWMAGIMASVFGGVQKLSLGIVKAPVTSDQVRNLRVDNIVSGGEKTFADLGIPPANMGAILPEYLWRFRPSGQYSAIKESAKNLRVQ
ncbi:complex I NDUFA9 subunit family protein [Litorivita sp. NS0012-18]|uniref:complex I NDUFA9 subunit family protein n=1 Tax=Litorivita sp. NS0012-18 TaxID=3127655 RepID=UPI0031068F70